MLSGALQLALALAIQAEAAAPPPRVPAPDIWTDDRPLTRLVQNLGRDIWNLPSQRSAVILSIGGTAAAVSHAADRDLSSWALEAGGVSYSKVGDHLGEASIEGAGALATYAVGKLAKSAEVTHIGSDLIRAQALNGLITVGLKVSIDRTRPGGGHYSLPSGHTSATFASAAILHGHYGWKGGVPAYGTAAFVAWTRVRDRAHWLSDTVLGAAIGTMVGQTVTRGHRPSTWQVTPVATTTGLAVYITRQVGG